MRERPILFSAPMVRAILEGRKTQTRRVVKPAPPSGHSFAGVTTYSTSAANVGKAVWGAGDVHALLRDAHRVRCPYGQPGDRLWVRETWAHNEGSAGGVLYRADHGQCASYHRMSDGKLTHAASRWRPSIHMRREHSRITLEVTGVRVERLQDISEADADAEAFGGDFPHNVLPHLFLDPDAAGDMTIRECFRVLWESINGQSSWQQNPWVWVIDFRRVEANDGSA